MDITSWLQIVLICFLGAISPGPSLALVIGNTIDRGRMYGVATSLGHGTGIGLWALLTAIGIANLIVGMSGLLVSVQALGAFLIAYIGFRTLTSETKLTSRQSEQKSILSKMLIRGTIEGFLISLLNPKIALFFLAIFSHFVHPDSSWIETGLMGVTAGVIDAVWYMTVAILLTGVGATRISPHGENIIRKTTGSLLILIALYLLGTTLRNLL